MKAFMAHTRSYIIRGLLACIPLGLSYLTLKFIYVFIDQKVMNLFDKFIGFRVPGLGILVFLIILYFIGLLVSNVIGHRLLGIIEFIFDRIPILRTTYQIGKQLSTTFSLSEKQVFKKVVFVDMNRSGVWSLGFVTGTILDKRNPHEKYLKVFLPTVPNPTTGFVVMVKESEILDPNWTVDEGVRTVISGGIIGPEIIERGKSL